MNQDENTKLVVNEGIKSLIEEYYEKDLASEWNEALARFCNEVGQGLEKSVQNYLEALFGEIDLEIEIDLIPSDLCIENAEWSGWYEAFYNTRVIVLWENGPSSRDMKNAICKVLKAHGVKEDRKDGLKGISLRTRREDSREDYIRDNLFIWDIEVWRDTNSSDENRVFVKTIVKTGPYVDPWDKKSKQYPALVNEDWAAYELKEDETLDDILWRVNCALSLSIDDDEFNEETEFWSFDNKELRERVEDAQGWYAANSADPESDWTI